MSRPDARPRPDPWRVPVIVAHIPDTGLHRELEASAARAARRWPSSRGLREILSGPRRPSTSRPGAAAGSMSRGSVRARIGQTCVVTLDPIESEIEEEVDLIFAPEAEVAAAGRPDRGGAGRRGAAGGRRSARGDRQRHHRPRPARHRRAVPGDRSLSAQAGRRVRGRGHRPRSGGPSRSRR